jgi:hypothetical protein
MARVAPALILALATLLPASRQDLAVPDIDGRPHRPLQLGDGETAHVLFVLAVDCPISNRYAPEMDRIVKDYAAKRVRSFFVYADPSATPARVLQHLAEFHKGIAAPAIIDKDYALTKAIGATVTPEAAVYTVAGRVYRGRIDDLYVSLGQTRQAPTRRDLRLSLDAVLGGLTVPVPETKAVGCYLGAK